MTCSSYGEGERVFAPPSGTFDVDWVASAACALEPSLAHDDAVRQAEEVWRVLRSGSRELGDGAVARVALEYVQLYDVL